VRSTWRRSSFAKLSKQAGGPTAAVVEHSALFVVGTPLGLTILRAGYFPAAMSFSRCSVLRDRSSCEFGAGPEEMAGCAAVEAGIGTGAVAAAAGAEASACLAPSKKVLIVDQLKTIAMPIKIPRKTLK
jgi:hypothetical protein